MRQGSNGRRPRRNNQGRRNVPLRAQTFDSNGPEGRIRGTAHQVYEKYLALARDASAQSDRIRAENLLQHAEHYSRIINESMDPEDEAERDNREAEAGEDREARDDGGDRGANERGNQAERGGRNGSRGRNRRRYPGRGGGDGRAAGGDNGDGEAGETGGDGADGAGDDRGEPHGNVEVVGGPGDGQS